MTAPNDALVKRLRILAGMLLMGERIAFGSDAAALNEAADTLAALSATAPDGWRGEWRADGYGNDQQSLFVGRLYVGHIMQLPSQHKNPREGQWRGWFMSDDDGDETGWFLTDDEARASVEKALFSAVPPAPAAGEVERLWEALQEVRPVVANAAADPKIPPWQKEVRMGILARLDAALAQPEPAKQGG